MIGKHSAPGGCMMYVLAAIAAIATIVLAVFG